MQTCTQKQYKVFAFSTPSLHYPPLPLFTQGDIRELLAEAVLLVTQHPAGKAALWTFNAPEQLRKGYELEEGVGVCDAMEAAARLFMAGGVEDEEEQGGEEDEQVVEVPMGGGWAKPQQHTVIEQLD